MNLTNTIPEPPVTFPLPPPLPVFAAPEPPPSFPPFAKMRDEPPVNVFVSLPTPPVPEVEIAPAPHPPLLVVPPVPCPTVLFLVGAPKRDPDVEAPQRPVSAALSHEPPPPQERKSPNRDVPPTVELAVAPPAPTVTVRVVSIKNVAV